MRSNIEPRGEVAAGLSLEREPERERIPEMPEMAEPEPEKVHAARELGLGFVQGFAALFAVGAILFILLKMAN